MIRVFLLRKIYIFLSIDYQNYMYKRKMMGVIFFILKNYSLPPVAGIRLAIGCVVFKIVEYM